MDSGRSIYKYTPAMEYQVRNVIVIIVPSLFLYEYISEHIKYFLPPFHCLLSLNKNVLMRINYYVLEFKDIKGFYDSEVD